LLGWWVKQQQLIPHVAAIALRILVVPASSAEAERQFSRAKRINSAKRESMKPGKLQALVLLGENMPVTCDVLTARHEARLHPAGAHEEIVDQ
jgi:hypothetical protein